MTIVLNGTTGITTPDVSTTTETISGGTANGVQYLNGSKAVTTNTALVFDGTNLGILGGSVTTPATKLHVVGNIRSSSGVGTTYSSLAYDGVYSVGTDLYLFAPTGYKQIFYANNAEKMRLDTDGNLLVGKTASAGSIVGAQLMFNGQIFSTLSGSTSGSTTMEVYSTDAAAYRFYVDMGGTIHATSASITSISDIRFKENIRDLNVGLDKIMALKPRLYDWKEGKGANIKNARGFIAQEFEQVFPDLIDTWKDPAPEGEDPYKSIRQDLIPVLVKAMQEQQALIESLTTRLTALEQA